MCIYPGQLQALRQRLEREQQKVDSQIRRGEVGDDAFDGFIQSYLGLLQEHFVKLQGNIEQSKIVNIIIVFQFLVSQFADP